MSAREVLQSWKEISAYLGRDIRTCCRWEENLGLPVHRDLNRSDHRFLWNALLNWSALLAGGR